MDKSKDVQPRADRREEARRVALRRLGRFVAVTPPAVTLLLAAATKRAAAVPSVTSSRQLKNRIGALEDAALSSLLARLGEGTPLGTLDGIGVCLAGLKALDLRLTAVEQGISSRLALMRG